MARRLGQLTATLSTPLMTGPVTVVQDREVVGVWSPDPIAGRFRIQIDQDNPDERLWLIAFQIWGPDGAQSTTSNIPELVYSSSAGGHYRYTSRDESLDVTLPAGYFVTRITAMKWEAGSAIGVTVRQLTLQRMIPISIE